MDPGFGAGMYLMSWERMDARNDQVRNDGGMDSGFGAGMHFMSWERMDARSDQVRNDGVYS